MPVELAGLATPLVGALAGFLGGLASERFKAGVAALDRELERLDAMHDDAVDVLNSSSKGIAVETELRRLARERQRLGQNLKRHLVKRDHWRDVEDGIAKFSGTLRRVNDLADQPFGATFDLEDVLSRNAQSLRGSIRAAAGESLIWRTLRR